MAEPRREFVELPPAVHGGDAPPGVVEFSTGVSPLPPPPSVMAAWRAADVTRYPHPTALPLREAVAARHGVTPDAVVVGAGSVELVWALARVFGGAGRRVGYVAPAFGEYAQAARASGAAVAAVAVDAECDLLFVARPGNPTLAVPSIEGARAALVAVDEAYQPLCDDVPPTAPSERVCVLRSLTKIFALPGLRLGYLLATPPVARAVQAALPPWNVSQPAIAAGLAALAEPIEPVRARIAELRGRMIARLAANGIAPVAAGGSFVVVDVGDAARFAAGMLARGVRVRDCTSFGLPAYVRLGVRGEDEVSRLVAAWQTVTP
ncbi:MAG TPA: aminotransferase class I/II-fold pyridoxal phosphate-dependent enzyme [Polyangia bacterium]|nr:aminotransferase class I/II-fold pyridoxal phosphate-dependent enzyme [Polyangia bacterium]